MELDAFTTLQRILVYYAMMCLVLMPFSIMVMVVMYKKGILKQFDMWLDKIIDGNKKAPVEEPAPVVEVEEREPNELVDEIAEKARNYGIATFGLRVGDKYSCHLSSTSRKNTFGAIEWESGNRFIGDVDKDGLFTSRKAGQVRLFFRRAGDNNDPGAAVYDIVVYPSNPSWFAQQILDFVLAGRKMTDVFVALQDRKSITMMPAKKIAEYEGTSNNEKKLLLQADPSNNLVRALYEIKNTEANRAALNAELEERFEHITTEGDIEIWSHGEEDYDHDIVDAYAWVKTGKNGSLLFGFGRMWREESEKEEFLMNIQMAEKMFVDLTGNEPLTKVKASEEEMKKLAENNAPAIVPPMADPALLPETTEPAPEPERTDEGAEESTGDEEEGRAEEQQQEEGSAAQEGSIDPNDIPETDDVPDTEGKAEESEKPETVDFDTEFPDDMEFNNNGQ